MQGFDDSDEKKTASQQKKPFNYTLGYKSSLIFLKTNFLAQKLGYSWKTLEAKLFQNTSID